jgi:hypothetical protein
MFNKDYVEGDDSDYLAKILDLQNLKKKSDASSDKKQNITTNQPNKATNNQINLNQR